VIGMTRNEAGGRRATPALCLALPLLLPLTGRVASAQETCPPAAVHAATSGTPNPSPVAERRIAWLGAHVPAAATLVITGDSLAEFWPKALPPLGLPEPAVFNFGVGGDQTSGTLWRLEHTAGLERLSPRWVVLFIGTNNLGAGAPVCAIVLGIRQTVHAVSVVWPRAAIILMTIPPRGPGGQFRDADRVAVNGALNDLPARVPGLVVVSLDPLLAAGAGQERGYLKPDNLHFTPAGYAAISQMLSNVIGPK
jgi:lysophospholipase L1-like esterase